MSTGVATPDADRAAYVDRVEAELRTVTGAVTLPDEFRITLTTRSSTIPVTLTNNTEQDLQVRVELDSDQLEFPDGDVLTPTLPPGTTRLEVRVRARTSGAFTLDVTVSSPDGTLVLDRSTFDIRSTAISGVGLLLSVGAGLFLAMWWGRHWRRDPPGPPQRTGPEASAARGRRPPTSAPSPGPDRGRPHRVEHRPVGGAACGSRRLLHAPLAPPGAPPEPAPPRRSDGPGRPRGYRAGTSRTDPPTWPARGAAAARAALTRLRRSAQTHAGAGRH